MGTHRVGVALASRDYDTAIQELQELVSAEPNDAPTRVLLARLLYAHKRDADRAFELLDEAQAVSPDLLTIVSSRAAILRAEDRDEEALQLLDTEVTRRDDFAAHLLRAEYCAVSGRPEQARQDYVHLTTFTDSAAEAYAALGRFHQRSGETKEAIAAWRAGLDLEPDDLVLQRMLTTALATSENQDARREGREMLDDLLARFPGDTHLLSLRATVLLDERTPKAIQEATETLERVVRADPRDIWAHLRLVQLAREADQRDRANDLVTRALGANPDSRDLLLLRANLESESNNVAVARELAESVLAADPGSVQARNLLAEMALRAGAIDRARQLNDQALELSPEDELAQVTHARILEANGQRAEAIQALESYRHSDTGRQSPAALMTLANLHVLQDDYSAAGALLEEAQKLAPSDINVFRARLRWLAVQGRFDDLLTELGRRRGDYPGESSVLIFAALLLAAADSGDYLHQARALLEEAVALDPPRSEGHLGLAQVRYRLGEADAAAVAYRRALELEPYNVQALNDLAWILNEDFEKPQEALELANKGVARYPNNPHLRDTRGVVLANLGRLADARSDLEACLQLSQEVPVTQARALLHLGRVCAEQGESATATRRLEEALAIDQQHGVLTDDERDEIRRLIDSAPRLPSDRPDTQ